MPDALPTLVNITSSVALALSCTGDRRRQSVDQLYRSLLHQHTSQANTATHARCDRHHVHNTIPDDSFLFIPCSQERLQEVKNLVFTAQQELALKRSAAIQEVGSAARELLRILKQERKWRQKGKPTGKINRQLSVALGNDAATASGDDAAAKVQSLDDAIKSFNALSTTNSKYDTLWDVQQRQYQQQEGQQLKAEEAWVRAWRKLADRARRVLEKSLAQDRAADDVDAVASADIDQEIEYELQKHNARAAARDAKQQQQIEALQQMVDEVAAQRREQISQSAIDEQVGTISFA